MRKFFDMKVMYLVLLLFFAFNATAGVPDSFASISKKTTPAVVNIFTSQKVEEVKNNFDMQEFMRNPFSFFENGIDMMERGNAPQIRHSLGSGFIIDPHGYIVTNYHVIEKADEIKIRLSDEDVEYKAEVMGVDPKTDLALIKINVPEDLPYLKFGDSSRIEVGDWILAIGNPFGLGGTVTTGIISAKSRHLNIAYDDFIQTDASINVGNSGGPMLNMRGEVIGINNLILSPGNGNIGIGFAIPSSTAQPIIQKLKDHGKVVRSWLGVKIQKMSIDIAREIGLKSAKDGVLVSSILKGGPAAKAGFMPGDVITRFDGMAINNNNVIRVIAETDVGKKVEVEILRGGKPVIIEMITEASQEEALAAQQERSSVPAVQSEYYFGIKVADITDSMRAKYRIADEIEGVIITDIKRDSVANLAGLMPGIVIMKINNADVKNIEHFKKFMMQASKDEKKAVLLYVYFKGESQFIVLKEE